MKRKVLTLIVCLIIFSFFACGYCLADGDAPQKVPMKDPEVISIQGKSVVETEKTALRTEGIIEMKNTVENVLITTVKNINGKTIVDISIPEGQQLIIDKPIIGDEINIHGGGSISIVENGDLNLLNGQKSDSGSNPNAGVNTQIISAPAQITQMGTMQIMTPVDGPVNTLGSAILGSTVTMTQTSEKFVLKKPAGVNTPKGAPRLGSDLGPKVIRDDARRQPDRPDYVNSSIAPKPYGRRDGASIVHQVTVEEKIEEE